MPAESFIQRMIKGSLRQVLGRAFPIDKLWKRRKRKKLRKKLEKELNKTVRGTSRATQLYPKPAPNKWKRALQVISLVLPIIVGVLWYFRLGEVPFISDAGFGLSIESEGVNLELTEDWNWERDLIARHVNIGSLDSITVTRQGYALRSESGDALLAAQGDMVSLYRLTIDEGAALAMEAVENKLQLFITQAPFQGELWVEDGDYVEVRESDKAEPIRFEQLSGTEFIAFESNRNNHLPTLVVLDFPSEAEMTLRNLKVDALGFMVERAANTSLLMPKSSIKEGTLTLYDVPHEEQFREGDRLRLSGLAGTVRELSFRDGRIYLTFEGSAKRILVGEKDGERNLAPTVLESIYHREEYSLVGAAILFLLGLITAIRELFPK